TAVALDLLGRHHARALERVARVLPRSKSARHRRDATVAEALQRLRRECRSRTAGAIEDHFRIAIGHGVLDLDLEEATRDPLRAWDEALLVLVALAHVDEHRRGGIGGGAIEHASLRVLGRDFADLGLHLGEELVERGHLNSPVYNRLF